MKTKQLIEIYPNKTPVVSLKDLQSRLQTTKNELILEALNLSIPIFQVDNPKYTTPYCFVTQADAARLTAALTELAQVA